MLETLFYVVSATVRAHPIFCLLVGPLILVICKYAFRLSPLHPLSHIPGPLKARFSSAYLAYHAYLGDECTAVHTLHERYGPIVRTGPETVDISDGKALHPIYVDKGGFLKPDFYGNFDIDGHKSIFSAIDPSHRAPRAKAVFAIFSTSNLRSGADVVSRAVDEFVSRIQREKARISSETKRGNAKATIDMLEICRALAIDVVTSYLFGMSYDACSGDQQSDEATVQTTTLDEPSMTASAMVDSFVAVGKFWYLPPKIFRLVDSFLAAVYPNKQADQSIGLVDNFVAKAVTQTITDKSHSSYPGRLLQAGFGESEVRAQCKDLIFAGTDSTAMNLATICFHLIKEAQVYTKLKEEITGIQSSSMDLQSLPYLRGVVKEGLRLAMANPSRLPRVVPSTGWKFNDVSIPAGTVVSCAPFELHLNPEVYPEPLAFRPERWLPENNPTEEMSRDHIAFGLGSRQCIARNLATVELFCAVKRIAEEDLLANMDNVKSNIEILEWFNSHVVGGKIEMEIKA